MLNPEDNVQSGPFAGWPKDAVAAIVEGESAEAIRDALISGYLKAIREINEEIERLSALPIPSFEVKQSH